MYFTLKRGFQEHFKHNFCPFMLLLLQFQTISAFKIEVVEGSMCNLRAHSVTCLEKKIEPKC